MPKIVFYADDSLNFIAPVPFCNSTTEIHLIVDDMSRIPTLSKTGSHKDHMVLNVVEFNLIDTGRRIILRLPDEQLLLTPKEQRSVKVCMTVPNSFEPAKRLPEDILGDGRLYYAIPRWLRLPSDPLDSPASLRQERGLTPCHIQRCVSGPSTLTQALCEVPWWTFAYWGNGIFAR